MIVRVFHYFLFLLVGSLIISCGATGPAFQKLSEIPPGKGLIYIYRSPGIAGAIITYDVYAGKEKIAKLQPGGYFYYFADPGELEIWGETEAKGSVTLDVRSGEEYYVKGGLSVGFLAGRPNLRVVAPDVGRKEIEECKLISKE